MQQRPTSVTVFGVLNIVFGALALLCLPITLLMVFGVFKHAPDPTTKALYGNPLYVSWTVVSSVVGLIAAVVELVAGIGLLKLLPWARVTSIGFAIYGIFASIASMVMTAVVMIPIVQKMDTGSGPEHAAAIGGMIGGVIGGIAGSCGAIIYPILLLIFMTRPKVKAAFVPQA